MADKGHSMVWGVVEYNAFYASFCWTPPALIKVAYAVSFLCMYLTWFLLLPSGARYIPNMDIYLFSLRYRSGTISLVLLVAPKKKPCPGFVHFCFPCLCSQSTRYHTLLSGGRQTPVIIISSPHSDIASSICKWVDYISAYDWIMSHPSTYMNPTNCDISVVKKFMKWIPKPWAWSCDNTIDPIIDQCWGAQHFPWQSTIMKCLNLSGMVSPPYVR